MSEGKFEDVRELNAALTEAHNQLSDIAGMIETAAHAVEGADPWIRHKGADMAGRMEHLSCRVLELSENIDEWLAQQCTYELSENQKKFVADAERQGFDVDYTYSGRGMMGATCPSVRVGGMGDFGTKAITNSDNMGLGYVIYAER